MLMQAFLAHPFYVTVLTLVVLGLGRELVQRGA